MNKGQGYKSIKENVNGRRNISWENVYPNKKQRYSIKFNSFFFKQEELKILEEKEKTKYYYKFKKD